MLCTVSIRFVLTLISGVVLIFSRGTLNKTQLKLPLCWAMVGVVESRPAFPVKLCNFGSLGRSNTATLVVVYPAEGLACLPCMASCVEPFSSSFAEETDARSGRDGRMCKGLVNRRPL
jgi:hypothetical protein